ncbi:MAG TPA: hypothetical protein VJ890_30170, partial [Vineibacter sp.]|nr:hypothetical protein [Vineibacter sp.]
MPGGGVRAELSIRMYRGLLGDFFLVRHTSRQRTYNMLIDCGVLQCIGVKAKKAATARGADRIKAGVVDLINDTGGRLDLVVATHQHYDHLSGFILANEAFKDIRIDKVWMAWTEDRKDDLANSYREKKNQALAALTALSRNQALAAMPGMETVTNLLQFYGPDDSPRGGALAVAGAGDDGDGDKLSGNASCEKVLEWLRLRAGPGNVDFLRPGDAKEWGLRGAFRAYVLGPPRSDKALRHLDPSKGEQREVYLASGEDIETASALAEIHGDGHAGERPEDQPFTRPHWRPYGANGVKTTATERRRLLKDPIVRLYRRKGASSRGIDDSWLGSAENLALKIDGDVNNTSLALALT